VKESILSTLHDLVAIDGPSGFEQPVVKELSHKFSSAGANVAVDRMGNLYASLDMNAEKPHLMISAHSDEIGAVVRHIDTRGFLRIDALGIVSSNLLYGRRVRVNGIPGVVGVKPGHLQTSEEQHRTPPIHQFYVDIGVSCAEEAFELGIRIGSPVAYDGPLVSYANSDRLFGKAIDNRLGCSVLLQLFTELVSENLKVNITGLIAVQEEIGLRGATVGANRVKPDFAIVLDTLPVGDTPDVPEGRIVGEIGKGPVLVLAESENEIGVIGNAKLNDWIRRAAEGGDVPLQFATSLGYSYTDAAAVHLQAEGIPTAVLGFPRRYSHSPICTFDINDAVNAVRILEALALESIDLEDLNFI
jgi:endoglucanase